MGAKPPSTVLAAQASHRGAVESQALGLTLDDLLYGLLALAALAVVWTLTARVVRGGAGPTPSDAKGTAHESRLKL